MNCVNFQLLHQLPGHEVRVHDSTECDCPIQSLPPLAGEGLEQDRKRTCMPWSHVIEHVVQAPQGVHEPSTENQTMINRI